MTTWTEFATNNQARVNALSDHMKAAYDNLENPIKAGKQWLYNSGYTELASCMESWLELVARCVPKW